MTSKSDIPSGKIVLVGNAGVGKTCVVRKATVGIFDPDSEPTLGASYTAKTVSINNEEMRLQIWDTAGQEKYRSMTPMYYQNSHVCLLLYSVTDRSSFDSIDEWIESLKQEADPSIVIYIVGNKIDLEAERLVSTSEGEMKAQNLNVSFYEVSALTGSGINDLFDDICEKCYKIINPPSEEIIPSLETSAHKKSDCC